jgi:hypothetical protein
VALEPDTYLTDGRDLYLFKMFLPTESGVMLEECYCAENITLTLKQFSKLNLMTVQEWERRNADRNR